MREGKVGIDSKSFLPPFLLHGVDSDESWWGRETLLLLGDTALMLVIGDWIIRFSSISSVIVSILAWDNKLMSGCLKDWLLLYRPDEEDDPEEAPWCRWECGGSRLLLDEIGSWASACLKLETQRLIKQIKSCLNGQTYNCFWDCLLP